MLKKNISSVVPTQGALVRANFDTRIGVRALITVTRGGKAGAVWITGTGKQYRNNQYGG